MAREPDGPQQSATLVVLGQPLNPGLRRKRLDYRVNTVFALACGVFACAPLGRMSDHQALCRRAHECRPTMQRTLPGGARQLHFADCRLPGRWSVPHHGANDDVRIQSVWLDTHGNFSFVAELEITTRASDLPGSVQDMLRERGWFQRGESFRARYLYDVPEKRLGDGKWATHVGVTGPAGGDAVRVSLSESSFGP